jgi:hypothetical protein
MTAPDGVDGLHLASNLLLTAGTQRPVDLLQSIRVLNE